MKKKSAKCIECGYLGIKESPKLDEIIEFSYKAYERYKKGHDKFFKDILGVPYCLIKKETFGSFIERSRIDERGWKSIYKTAVARISDTGRISHLVPISKGSLIGFQNLEENIIQDKQCEEFFKRRSGFLPKQHAELKDKARVDRAISVRTWFAIGISLFALITSILVAVFK